MELLKKLLKFIISISVEYSAFALILLDLQWILNSNWIARTIFVLIAYVIIHSIVTQKKDKGFKP